MSLETATYISDLVATNPTGADPKSQGDDHIRLVKSTVKTTFPNVTGAMTATHTELNYSVGVTSAIQTQINSKGAITGQTWSGTHVFPTTTSIGTVTGTEISYLSGVTSGIQAQLNTITGTLIPAKGAISGQTWTGTHNFTGATVTVATPSTTSQAANKGYVDGVAMSAVMPGASGQTGKAIMSDGSATPLWAYVGGQIPIGALIGMKNNGSTYTYNGSTYLRTGTIATSATYPSAPTQTIYDGQTWVSKTGISLVDPALATDGSGTVIGFSTSSAGTAYAYSTDNGATWSSATFPASFRGVPVWCGTFFLAINTAGSATTFYTSTTGATGSWTSRTVTSGTYTFGVYGASGCLIMSTSTDGLLTTDGINYTAVALPAANLTGAYGSGIYLLGQDNSTNGYRSIDGKNFVLTTLPMGVRYVATYVPMFAYGNGVFLYVQDVVGSAATVKQGFTTPDGLTYTAIAGCAASSSGIGSRSFSNGTFVVALSSGTTAYASTNNGASWSTVTMPSSADWRTVIGTSGGFCGLVTSSTSATQSVSGGTYTDTSRALYADYPSNTRPLYMRVA